MLRPGFPGGLPGYPPRPGEPGPVRYVYPGQPGPAPPISQPGLQPYSRGEPQPVYVRQPPIDSRAGGAERSGARMPLRQSPFPIYHQDYRDGVAVLGVGQRGEAVQLVPGPPSTLAGLLPHPALLSSPAISHSSSVAAEVAAGLPSTSKRPRMGADHSLRPLSIDTRESKEPGYHPQVEAISPTPEDTGRTERDDVRSTKDDLLQKISKVDREIAKAESQIAKLKKKQHDLEDAANRPTSDSASDEATPNMSIAQNVYSDNRRKANQSHASLEKFSAKNDLPLYNQPSDTEVYSNNKKNYTVFKKKLVDYFKKSQVEREARDRYLTVTYCKLTSQWTKKVDRVENSRKRKEKEGRCREMYEKIFPELRKQREDKERDARLGTRGVVKSDADFEDVIERLQEQEMEDKKMHSYAVIPPLLLPPDERKRKFTNTNGLIPDPMLIYNERKYVNMWTDQERETFKEKYLQHPKNFGMIAQYLERKTVSDCVQYYYMSKKTENYKQLLRKSRTRPRGAARRAQAPQAEVIGPGIPGVVTRRKAEELPKEVSGDNNSKGNSRSNTPVSGNVKLEEEVGNEKENGRKKPDRAREAKKTADNQNDSSDEEDTNQTVKSGPHPCLLCKAVVESSRPVTKANAVQLGLREDEIGAEARVCNPCWCKTLKKKHAAACPVPACTSSKGRSRGKLRHLPSKWVELDQRSKDVIAGELQLPEHTKRVCTACFTRITRRISQLDLVTPAASGEAVPTKKEKEEPVSWVEQEIETAKESLRQHGTNWAKMAEAVKGKTEEQCKKFFYGQRKRLQLDKLVTEYKKATRPEGSDKPSLTSDEESGSTTSSCEEDGEGGGGSKAGAAVANPDLKPPTAPPASTEPVKTETKKEEGYDSAATISADETVEQLGGKARGGPVLPPATKVTATVSVQDMMEKVISKTLQTPGTTVSAVTAPQPTNTLPHRSEIPSLSNMLEQAEPVPVPKQRNYVLEAINKDGSGPAAAAGPTAGPVSGRPDLEVRPVPGPGPVPGSGPGSGAGSGPGSGPGPGLDVLDLTVTRPDRDSPAPASHASHLEHSSYPGFAKPPKEPVPESQGKEPPMAHGGGAKSKTTHQDIIKQDPYNTPYAFRKDNHSPAPYIDQRPLVHSPGPSLIPRGDPRKEIKSQPPPLQHKAPARPVEAPARERSSGSIMQGTPHQRAGQPGQHPQHSPRQFDQSSQAYSKGSITTGHPLYPSKAGRAGPPVRPPADGSRPGQPSLPASGYSPYPPPRPATLEQSPSGNLTSRRSIIDEDYRIAQTLPRKDPREGQPGPGYPRPDPHRREEPRPDPRYSESRPGMYAAQRPPFKGDERIRGDPRADIPSSRELVTDPRVIYRPDPRLTVDPRAMVDARGRYAQAYDPRLPPAATREPGRRSPHRAATSTSTSHHPGLALPPVTSRPPAGSITQGVPKARDVEIYHSPRHPEVSITKQSAAGPSREYPNSGLAALADVAESQQRISEARGEPRASAASRSEPVRSLPGLDPRFDPRAVRAEPGRSSGRESSREQEERERQQQQHAMMMKLSTMSEPEKARYLSAMAGTRNTEQMTASNLIDIIITHQINKNTVGPPAAQNSRHSPQAAADGKDSPSKPPSRSPSVKSLTERDGMEGGPGPAIRTSPGTMGEHIENMINKEVTRNSTSSPYPGPSSAEAHEHWKRRGYPGVEAGYSQPRPPSNSHPGLGTDERQILRVAQNASPRPDKPPSRTSALEAISPPSSLAGYYPPPPQDAAMARFLAARRSKEAADVAAAQAAAKSGFGAHFMDDYVKHKITEVMKNEKAGGAGPSDLSSKAGPASMGPPHKRPLEVEARGSPLDHPVAGPDSPRKRYKPDEAGVGASEMPDSPESGDMVIDESARPDSAHSHKTNSPAPNSEGSHYPAGYSRPGQPRTSPAPRPPPQPVAPSLGGARYEPLSDDE